MKTKSRKKEETPKYYVLLSVVHDRCGKRIETADPALTSRRAVVKWVRQYVDSGELRLQNVYCTACRTDLKPTHLLVGEVLPFKVRAVVSMTKIEDFDPSRWPDLPR